MRTAQLGLHTVLAAVAAFIVFAVPVGAESDIAITFDDLIFAPPGSVVLLSEIEVDAELVGRTCFLSVGAKNQASVHPGNDLIVSTGTSEAVIVGVEDEANGGTSQSYEMVVGPTITAQLRLGQDGVSSLGFGLTFDCEVPTETSGPELGQQQLDRTTTTPPTTQPPTTQPPPPPTTQPSTTQPPTTASSTSTTASVPATVAGAVTGGTLPETPPARAVTRAPAYTG